MKKTLTLFGIGIAVAVNAQWTTYDDSNSGIATNSINRVNVDNNGDILISTLSGLNVKTGSSWALHNVASGALGHNSAVISFREGNNLWITTDGGGVSRYNGTSWTIFNTSNSSISDNRVYNIGKSPSGIMWFGTRDGGLCSYNGSVFTTLSVSANLSVNYNRVMGMDIDANGVIWIGTAGGGLAKYNPATNQWAQYNTGNSTILHDDVYELKVGPDGMIWAGTFGGLSIFNPNTNTFVSHLSTLNSIMPGNYIRGIDFDGSGRGYIAMGFGGIARVETNYSINTIWTSSNSNLASDTCWHLGYGDGRLWVATFAEGACVMEVDVSVQEHSLVAYSLNLFPNPSNEDATLVLSGDADAEVNVSLMNESGQLVWTSTQLQVVAKTESRITIPVAGHAAGIYFVVVTDNRGGRQTLKIVHE